MLLKYNIEIDSKIIISNLTRIVNQVYKLLPMREEGSDWETALSSIMEELGGMSNLLQRQKQFFTLLCRLEGLFDLKEEDSFLLYRKTIFDCLGLLGEIKNEI